MAGMVKVDGIVATKPGHMISDQHVDLKPTSKYVSRGALKIKKAIKEFDVQIKGKNVFDVGAGSGGFSQVLIEKDAAKVIAIDVGYGQFSWELRNHPKVVLFERTNIRNLDPKRIVKKADMAVVDLSFISVIKVIDNLKMMLTKTGDIIILIKPQFEAGKNKVPKGGIVKNKTVHCQVINIVSDELAKKGVNIQKLTYSPIAGAKGNIEFLGIFSLTKEKQEIDSKKIINEAHKELNGN